MFYTYDAHASRGTCAPTLSAQISHLFLNMLYFLTFSRHFFPSRAVSVVLSIVVDVRGVIVRMCLQWCHVTSRLIDNDLPCDWCALFPPERLPPEQTCATCAHCAEPADQPPFCTLTAAPLPRQRACCHWNTPLEARATLHLVESDIAPGLLVTSVAALFDESDTAPPYSPDAAGHVRVALSALATPLVYGVASNGWDAALPPLVDEPLIPALAPPDVGAALLALLDALDGAGDSRLAHSHLRDLLAHHSPASLPLPWLPLIAETLALAEVRGDGEMGR